MQNFIILLLFSIILGCETENVNGTGKAKFAPLESVHQFAYYSLPTPPSGFTAVVGWMQAIDIDGKGSPSKVEVDWMTLRDWFGNSTTDRQIITVGKP